jgi:hypothetical protein
MAHDRIAVDPLGDPHERAHQDRIDLAWRGLRTLTPQPSRLAERFWEEVDRERETAHLSIDRAMAAVADREPELYRAARDSDSVLLTGTRGQWAVHLAGEERRKNNGPKRTSSGVDLDESDATRTAAKERGFTPIDEKLVQNFLDSDQIDQDADEGDPDAQRTMAVRAWLHKKRLRPTAANIKAAFKAIGRDSDV